MKSFIAICLLLCMILLSSCGEQTTNQGNTAEQPKDAQPVSIKSTQDQTIISAGYANTVKVRNDGTVVSVGKNDEHQCDVSSLNNSASEGSTSPEPSETISERTALGIAMEHAGVSNVTKYQIKNEIEHGKAAYYIEFLSGDMVYEYYIEKSSGEIISSAYEKND